MIIGFGNMEVDLTSANFPLNDRDDSMFGRSEFDEEACSNDQLPTLKDLANSNVCCYSSCCLLAAVCQ